MSIDPLQLMSLAFANSGQPTRTLDWEMAATLISLHKPTVVYAGLREDWGWTGSVIYSEGQARLQSGAYVSSVWATPVIRMLWQDRAALVDGTFEDEKVFLCHQLKAEGTVDEWTPTALALLRGETVEPVIVRK